MRRMVLDDGSTLVVCDPVEMIDGAIVGGPPRAHDLQRRNARPAHVKSTAVATGFVVPPNFDELVRNPPVLTPEIRAWLRYENQSTQPGFRRHPRTKSGGSSASDGATDEKKPTGEHVDGTE